MGGRYGESLEASRPDNLAYIMMASKEILTQTRVKTDI